MRRNWNTTDIPLQENKIFLITGANSGLGLGTAKAIATKGGRVVMAVRNMEKGQQAAQEIIEETPAASIEVMQLDLADLDSVKAFSDAFKQKYQKLDVLINNAGVMWLPKRQETMQGFELQFGTNHLGHFALTAELLELLEKTPQSRIVSLGSIVAKSKQADIYLDDLQSSKRYSRGEAYAQSKLANIMFAMDLQEKLKQANYQVISVAAHPGYTATNLQQHMGVMGVIANFLMAQKLAMGILPTLRAAIDPEVKGGEYFGPLKLNEYRGYPEFCELPEKAADLDLRRELWQISESLTNTKYPF
ncbi:MAG: SDR family NAD(P)-dependent oxidoreductase [Porticoccaceae bacterium]|nr:SDR family NAD(P)-dependent oxidoreductase [Porticoccaceae bacterium]